MRKLSSFKRQITPACGGGEGGGTQRAAAPHLHFCSENEISIQPAALWTPQVPRFHRCEPFTKTHLKKKKKKKKRGANSFFQIHCCQGDDQLRAADLFVYRGRPAEWLGSGRVKGAVKRTWRFISTNLRRRLSENQI